MTEKQEQKQGKSRYEAEQITVLTGLSAVRKSFDLNQLLKEVRKRGDAKKLVNIIKDFILLESLRYKIGEKR